MQSLQPVFRPDGKALYCTYNKATAKSYSLNRIAMFRWPAKREQRLQIPSRLIVFPQENHWIAKGEDSRFFYQEVLAWLEKYL